MQSDCVGVWNIKEEVVEEEEDEKTERSPIQFTPIYFKWTGNCIRIVSPSLVN